MASTLTSSNNQGSSKVLFSRSSIDNQEDIWDDRALIKAYDKSVRRIKKALNNKLESNSNTKVKEVVKNRKISEKSITNSESKDEAEIIEEDDEDYEDIDENEEGEESNIEDKAPIKDWNVGDLCTAVYSEDGLKYPAEIITIFTENHNKKNPKCVVRYLYYLNEEEHYLSQLTEYEGPQEKESSNKKIENSKKSPVKTKKNQEKKTTIQLNPNQPLFPPIPPPPLPIQLSNLLNTSNQNEREVISKEDALHSMLMSWYMSGYHTGYYFGLTQANAASSKSQK